MRVRRLWAGLVAMLVLAGWSWGAEVTGLTLVQASADTDLLALTNGSTVDLAVTGTALNVRADVMGSVGSVRFGYGTNANFRTENVASYAMAGDTSGDYNAWTPTVGTHTIIATPYESANAGGAAGIARTVTFTVVNGAGTPPPPPAAGENDVAAYPHSANGAVSGELRTWHKVTIGFDGPNTHETATPNPFTDYRLDVTFTNGSAIYVVPGYYAADGNAANSGADAGRVWLVHFTPDRIGTWTWRASFTTGANVAQSGGGSSAGYMDGRTGSFSISTTDKSGRDLRGKGRLQYVNRHHLRFAQSGEYFLKCGADAPENLLAYADFDGPFKTDGQKDDLIKTWSPHQGDWTDSDPTWAGGKGKGLVGAINYLAGKGMNAFSFLTMNIGGDDKNVFPYTTYSERLRMDVSRLAQWEVVFEHADRLGMYLHVKTQETENELLLDGGDVGLQRRLYYRELVARFGHHLALNWNLGEEDSDQTDQQRKDMAEWFRDHDPYRHHVVIHTYPGHQESIYRPLLGSASELTGVSIQIGKSSVHAETKKWLDESAAAGKPWVVANDEQGGAKDGVVPDAVDYNHDVVRKEVLWGNIMAGGAGVEYYFGYDFAESDLTCQDWRSRDRMWDQSRHALEFFRNNNIPFQDMKNDNAKSSSASDYCFYKNGEIYVVYLKSGGTTSLDLTSVSGTFSVQWFDPRNGGNLQNGSVISVTGGGSRALGNAPSSATSDWAVLIRRDTSTPTNQAPTVSAGSDQTIDQSAQAVLDGTVSDDGLPGGRLTTAWSKVSGPGTVTFGNASAVDTTAAFGAPGVYVLRLTASDAALSASDEVTVVAVAQDAPQTLEFSPVEDAYLESGVRYNNAYLKVESGRRTSFLKFDVTGLSGTVGQTVLRLRQSGDVGYGTFRVYRGSHDNWTEDDLSAASAPDANELVGIYAGSVGADATVELDLSGLQTGGGVVTLLVEHEAGGNDVWFSSKEGPVAPVLLVAVQAEDPNRVPIAVADAYRTTEGASFFVPAAEGVLDNDTDPDGDLLLPVLQDSPLHGSLVLYPDGAFDYMPEAGFVGTDRFTYQADDGHEQSVTVEVVIDVERAPTAGETIVAINCGGKAYVAADGTLYEADSSYIGGRAYSRTGDIAGTDDDTLYQSERYGTYSYEIPLSDGEYVVVLQFAEIYWNASGKRVFDVLLEGQEVLSDVDVFATVGANAAWDRSFAVTITDGVLNIALQTDVNNAKLSALRVIR